MLKSNWALVCMIILENLFLYIFYNSGLLQSGKNAWGLFITSVAIGILLVYRFVDKEILPEQAISVRNFRFDFVLILYLIAFAALGYITHKTLANFPVDPNWSDIIPIVQHQCRQFIHGLSPYAPINYFGYPEYPNNLPMKWLPFVPAELLSHDYRMLAFLFLALTGAFLIVRTIKYNNIFERIVIVLMLCMAYILLLRFSGEALGESLELLIVVYYMLLVLSLNTSNGWLQGCALTLCILSRYSLLLWLPLYAYVLWLSGNLKILLRAVLTTIFLCIALTLPFLYNYINVFVQSFTNYDIVANYEWTHHANASGHSTHLFSGVGFAYFINTRFTSHPIAWQIQLLQQIQFLVLTIMVTGFGIWYFYSKRRIDYRIFLMGSFKIYLAIFLFLIKIPYVYLMCVGNFVSLAIFAEQLRYRLIHDASEIPSVASEPVNSILNNDNS